MNAADDRLLSAKEVASRLARHVSYIRAATRRGMPTVIPGRYDWPTVVRWLEKHPHPRRQAPR